jgi:parvulin-like peptidyl-prolyl isomerase
MCLLFAAFSLKAGAQAAEESEKALPVLPLTTTLPRTYPVITVQSDCPKTAKTKGRCKTVVTRAEFEELVNAINPRMIKVERQQLAQTYGRMLALSNEALNRGIEKKPEMQALLRYVRASALGGALYKQVLRTANTHSEEDVEKYYHAHASDFDRYSFQRLFIPATKQGESPTPDAIAYNTNQPSTAGEMKALAENMHARAVGGEDFLALQKEAFAQSGIKSEASVDVADVVRGSLPAEDNQAFDLAPGAVSAIITSPTGYTIYKLISKQTPPLKSIEDQVSIEMENRHSEKALKEIENITVNNSYFEKYDTPAPDPNEPEVDND